MLNYAPKGPLLLGSDVTNLGERSIEWKNLAKHVDEDQVKLDVNRSFVFYPHGKSG